jgi:hypothetical protein
MAAVTTSSRARRASPCVLLTEKTLDMVTSDHWQGERRRAAGPHPVIASAARELPRGIVQGEMPPLFVIGSDWAVTEVNAKRTVQDNKGLIGVVMMVPYEVAFKLHDFELIIVHFSNDPWLPLGIEQSKFLSEVD